MLINSYAKRHTPVAPRPYQPGGIMDMTERERAEASLVEWKASPEEMAEIIRKYGEPNKKLSERKGFPMKKRGGVA